MCSVYFLLLAFKSFQRNDVFYFFDLFFFFNDTATTEIYTLSLHDALPISNEAPTAKQYISIPASASARDVAVIDAANTEIIRKIRRLGKSLHYF